MRGVRLLMGGADGRENASHCSYQVQADDLGIKKRDSGSAEERCERGSHSGHLALR